ncbi:antibiotic biosynthesis monooxygenase family protein [Larkinella sp.]|uniref:antibiotic biosynthesis monooxygenase family protein n=1 Tax=Larkinella sp. TaxID=2034517 RepID=UPI003BA85E0E
MYARVIQVLLKPNTISEATAYFRDSVGPALKELDGFKNSRFLTNPETNQCLMVTLWESEAARKNAETNGFLQGVLKKMGDYFAGSPTIDYYEVGIQVV